MTTQAERRRLDTGNTGKRRENKNLNQNREWLKVLRLDALTFMEQIRLL
jgi:hypothetical protein